MNKINIGEVGEYIKVSIEKLSYLEKIYIGLSGGSSLDMIYNNFTNIFKGFSKELREKIYFCFVDERVVSFESEESNYKGVYEKFFSKLISEGYLGENQILKINLDTKDIAGEYFREVPRIDLALFGVGEDGHIASLFPKHRLLGDEKKGFLEIFDSPKLPPHRITVSKNMIYDIKVVFVFFIGEKKKKALEGFFDEKVGIEELPVKMLKDCGEVILVG